MSGIVTKSRLNESTGPFVVFGSGVVFSFGPLVFRRVDVATEWQFLFYRSLSLALVTVVVLSLRHRSRLPAVLRTISFRHALAGLLLALMFTGFIVSLERVDAATVLLIQTLAPFSAAGLGWLLIRERVVASTWVAMFIAMVGVAIMVGVGRTSTNVVGLVVAGILPVLLGIYAVLVRTSTKQDPAVPILLGGTFAASIAGVIAGVDVGLDIPINEVGLAFISGGILVGLALPFFNAASRVVPAARATLLLLSEVVLAPVWVWIWQDETPSDGTLIGGAVILTALIWMMLGTETRKGLAATSLIRPSAWRANRPRSSD